MHWIDIELRMHGQHSRRRREIRTVSLSRTRSGFGFTITGELPCRLGGVLPGSAADCAGLQLGDRLIGINGQDVSMLSHDEVVRRIGSCRNILRLNIAEHSSEESSADSSDNAEMYAGGLVNSALHPQPTAVSSGKHRPPENMLWEAQQHGSYSGSGRNKYGRHIRSGHTERWHTRHADRFVGSRSSNDYLDLHARKEIAHNANRRRKTKHTVITREARIGLRPPERRPPSDTHDDSDDEDDDDDDISLSSSELQVVVGYSGSVEMPSNASRLAGSRLQSIRAAVGRLRATNRARSLVVMDIGADGIRLTDAMCRVVACYVTSRIAFCGICPDDRRFFGIVMTSAESRSGDGDKATNSSCHVFMVDPEIAEHRLHAGIAARLGLNCTMDLDTPRCLEFPLSAVPIIRFLGRLYRHRKSSALLPGNFCSSNVHDICEGKVHDDRVYVVDALKENGDQRSCGDGNDASLVPDEASTLFIHNLSVIDPVPDDRNLLDDDELLQSRKRDELKCLGRGSSMARSLSQASSILRDSNRHLPSGSLRRVTTTLDDNSFRHMLTHSAHTHSRPFRHYAAVDDDDSSFSVQGDAHSGSASPMPAPPLPPKQCHSKRNMNTRLADRPVQVNAVSSYVGAESTPVVSQTPNGACRPLPVSQSCSASKPPLPERRPILSRPMQKAAGIPKQDMPDRPKSTPPVNKMSLPAAVETANYDSDPGGQPKAERGSRHERVICQSDDNDLFQSPEDVCVELVSI